MARASTIQSSFLGGEISPLLYARMEVPRYKESLAICQNYIPTLQGPKVRRPGTTFVLRCRYANQKSRLIPFEFSTSQAYTLEFSGSGFIRFFKNGAPVTRDSSHFGGTFTISAASKASPITITGVIT